MVDMAASRAVLILGMHRSGTSALTRGVEMLGVFLGRNLLSARPDNPTGYWEDKNICALNERLLALFGVKWEEVLLADAIEYVASTLAAQPLWGFKDPRTIRLLPFWQSVLARMEMEESYLVVIRNPRSVAMSLSQRQGMDVETAHLLWLTYMIPNLGELANRHFIVADYDVVMADPKRQLERIAHGLKLPLNNRNKAGIEEFASNFLNPSLRHSFFDASAFDTSPNLRPLTREAYLWLRWMATDRIAADSPQFWSAWKRSREAVRRLIIDGASG